LTDLPVRVAARAARSALAGERGGRLLVRVTAPPVDGRANEAVCRLVAKALGIAPTGVAVLRGHGARDKVLRIEGVSEAEIRARLGL
jgi:uncharacterized protein YggU (UPF0235/DUF167 family)